MAARTGGWGGQLFEGASFQQHEGFGLMGRFLAREAQSCMLFAVACSPLPWRCLGKAY